MATTCFFPFPFHRPPGLRSGVYLLYGRSLLRGCQLFSVNLGGVRNRVLRFLLLRRGDAGVLAPLRRRRGDAAFFWRRLLLGEETRFLLSILSGRDNLLMASVSASVMVWVFFMYTSTKNMEELAEHAREIIRLSKQVVPNEVHCDAEAQMARWSTMPLPVSDQVVMRNVCVRVRPVLREMLRRMQEQQTRLDALELLVMNMVHEKET